MQHDISTLLGIDSHYALCQGSVDKVMHAAHPLRHWTTDDGIDYHMVLRAKGDDLIHILRVGTAKDPSLLIHQSAIESSNCGYQI